jgi:hypothetical protein
MSKKHFELLAKYIESILDPHARLQAAVAVASACREANSRFDCDRFFAACRVGPIQVTDRGVEYAGK